MIKSDTNKDIILYVNLDSTSKIIINYLKSNNFYNCIIDSNPSYCPNDIYGFIRINFKNKTYDFKYYYHSDYGKKIDAESFIDKYINKEMNNVENNKVPEVIDDNLDNTLYKEKDINTLIDNLLKYTKDLPQTRNICLVITKLEEAQMWLEKDIKETDKILKL